MHLQFQPQVWCKVGLLHKPMWPGCRSLQWQVLPRGTPGFPLSCYLSNGTNLCAITSWYAAHGQVWFSNKSCQYIISFGRLPKTWLKWVRQNQRMIASMVENNLQTNLVSIPSLPKFTQGLVEPSEPELMHDCITCALASPDRAVWGHLHDHIRWHAHEHCHKNPQSRRSWSLQSVGCLALSTSPTIFESSLVQKSVGRRMLPPSCSVILQIATLSFLFGAWSFYLRSLASKVWSLQPLICW